MKKFPLVCLLMLAYILVKSEPHGFKSFSDSTWQSPGENPVKYSKKSKSHGFSTSPYKNSDAVVTSNKSTIIDPIIYCNPAINQVDPCNYGWISNVTLGNTLNKNSACSGGYADYTTTDTLITAAGETINFSVSDGSTTGWSQYVFIFIDYNADGDFDDAGEKVADGYYMDPFGFNATGSFAIPSLLAGGDYRIRVICEGYSSIASACNTDLGEAEDYILRIPLPVYCAPVIGQPCDMWISNVTIGTINNNSTQANVCTAGGYSDYYPALTAIAGPGQTVNFSMSGTGNNFTNQFADVYVDYNGDGDFDDAGENVSGFALLGYSGETVPGSFVIPQNQSYGFYRMRFKSYNIFELQPGPCGNSINGETEDYRLLVTCVSNGSQIIVKGNNIIIPDDANAPGLADFSDFGNVPYGTQFNRTFVIENNGTGALNLSGVTIDGPDAAFFSVLTQPAAVVAPGDNTSFTIQFSPTSLFNYYANLHIGSDNCSLTDYNFAIQGTGSCSLDGPEINLQGNNIDIAAFDFLPSLDDNTDYGTVVSNAVVTKTFTIQNLGSQDLEISAPIQLITYDGPLQFAVTNPPAAIIPAGGSTSFTIGFSAAGEGFKYAYVRVSSNDCDESTYDFLIGGTVECPLLQPEINIKGNGQDIADGNSTTNILDNTDFGVAALNNSVSRTFVIENNGADPLSITGIDFSGTNAAAFTVTGLPSSIVAPGSSTSFTVQFTALVTGVETAVVHVHNTDCNEGDYDFAIRGTDGTPCTPAADQPCSYVSISNVSIGTINNTTSCSGGYADYSASISASVQAGIPVNFSIENGGFIGASTSIYADLNADGDFDDANEQLASLVYADAGMAATGSFIVPSLQPLGNYRLRIVSEYFGYGFTFPCYTYNGEIEDYTLTVGACVPNGSDIVVSGNNSVIPDGDIDPVISDFTDFGPVALNTTITRTYTINNPGSNTLHISAINFTGINANAFTIVNQPASAVAAGTSTSFTIQFAPVNPGLHVAVVHVVNDNCIRSDYDFAIRAESVEFTTLNIKMFIQGYYQNAGSPTPMDNFGSGGCLYVIGGASNQTDVDNVTVSLMDASTGALIGSATGVLQTNGGLSLTLPATLLDNSYYLKLNHRNSIETWSANPVLIKPVTTYDFTSSAGQAYQGNEVEVEPGVFAIYSGDIIDAVTNTEGLQDGVVESADYSKMENDVYMVTAGYTPSDITGDGVVESADYSIMENNVYLTISVKKPF